MSTANVLIGIPSTGTWASEFGLSLVGLVAAFDQLQAPGFNAQALRIFHKEGSILPQLRQQIMEEALRLKATHLLFLDSDQAFPPDTLHRLLAHKKPVVGCNIATKKFPCNPTARNFDKTNRAGVPVYSDEVAKGLQRVWRVGTGVLLVETFYIERIPKPWFPIKWVDEMGDFQGEDWSFMELLDKYDVPVYIDHDLSKEVEHVGKCRYDHSMVLAPQRLVQVP